MQSLICVYLMQKSDHEQNNMHNKQIKLKIADGSKNPIKKVKRRKSEKANFLK